MEVVEGKGWEFGGGMAAVGGLRQPVVCDCEPKPESTGEKERG
jgi:hypothetical protein